ncbi:MAG: carbohydrate-binding family 9-like protein [Acidobacteria bacterium]|nr:carbohydrate-binding family 9-like protein [Acidobacteriota bacterium]MCI0621389.1 carbohydrate-binding family 9-like protein [Acidobacteriota bacterium]MCI0722723.1 carbohydrate-binding family 9-like protein [Acidobacteriota bacterium]
MSWKHKSGVLFVCSVLLMAAGVMVHWRRQAAPAPANLGISRYTVKRTLGPIKIDGVFDEPSWRAAASTGPFRLNDGSGSPPSRVEAKMLWDEQNLYFAFECDDSDLSATMTKRDEHLWQEEVVEIFVDPDGDEKNYIELEVNPLGTFIDLFVLTPVVPIPFESYNIPAKWAVKVDGTIKNSSDRDKGWTVELSLPLKEAVTAPNLPPKDGDKWRLNLYRIERKPLEQYIAWSPTLKPSFHTPSRFGEVTFSTWKAGE